MQGNKSIDWCDVVVKNDTNSSSEAYVPFCVVIETYSGLIDPYVNNYSYRCCKLYYSLHFVVEREACVSCCPFCYRVRVSDVIILLLNVAFLTLLAVRFVPTIRKLMGAWPLFSILYCQVCNSEQKYNVHYM